MRESVRARESWRGGEGRAHLSDLSARFAPVLIRHTCSAPPVRLCVSKCLRRHVHRRERTRDGPVVRLDGTQEHLARRCPQAPAVERPHRKDAVVVPDGGERLRSTEGPFVSELAGSDGAYGRAPRRTFVRPFQYSHASALSRSSRLAAAARSNPRSDISLHLSYAATLVRASRSAEKAARRARRAAARRVETSQVWKMRSRSSVGHGRGLSRGSS